MTSASIITNLRRRIWKLEPRSTAKSTGYRHMDGEDGSSSIASHKIFPFLDLPAELREQIYLYAIGEVPPIDTAAIPGSPDRVIIPKLAQLSRQTRREALHTLLRNRPVEVSLHCPENLSRALMWADKWQEHVQIFSTFVFTGRLEHCGGNFFEITLERKDEQTPYAIHAKQAVSQDGVKVVHNMRGVLESRLSESLGHDKPSLNGNMLVKVIRLMDMAARRDPQEFFSWP